MSFFTEPKTKKRKTNQAPATGRTQKRIQKPTKPARPSRPARDEEISSGSDDDGVEEPIDELTSGSDEDSQDDEAENAAEKRLRLAERYLENVRSMYIHIGDRDIDTNMIVS